MDQAAVFVINSGSSSLKTGLFQAGNALLEGAANGIGKDLGDLVLKDGSGKVLLQEKVTFATQKEALSGLLDRVRPMNLPAPQAVGHRVVHGGPKLVEHQKITPGVLQTLQDSVHFAPLHIPTALELIQQAQSDFPGLPQFACFDTAFHRTLPDAASRYPLPAALADEGVRRYGFHGLSYESILHQLGEAVPSRLIVAHLGNGCSVTAILDRKSVDTSMGLTPTGGVVMATRAGDLDPGVLLYLMRVKNMNADDLEAMLNHQAGLVALCGKADLREVESAANAGDAASGLALEVFFRDIAKTIAGYVSVLGGVDLVVFTGGIGEHSDRARREILAKLAFLGSLAVRTLPSEEEAQIARHCWQLLAESP